MAPPDVSPMLRELAVRALAVWGLDNGKIAPVHISENVTFRVDTPDATFVLRMHRPEYHTLAELQSEHVWTSALLDAGLEVPTPLKSPDGSGYITLPCEDGPRNIGILRWVDGELLGSLFERHPEQIPKYFKQLGCIAAAMHNQAASWEVPAGFQRHSFDVDGLVGRNPFWGPFWELPGLDAAQRALMGQAREAIAGRLNEYGKDSQTFSMIHADLHPYNVVVGDSGLHIIDFDDAGFGWHQYELAVALYHFRLHESISEIQTAMVDGYRSVRPLSDTVVEMLPMFFLIRSLVHLGWRQLRPEHGTDLSGDIAEACCEIQSWLNGA